LTAVSEHSRAYNEMLGKRRLAVSFQTTAELLGAGFARARQKRLDDLLKVILRLPQQPSTDRWYARVVEKRAELNKRRELGAGADAADVWIISSCLEYALPLLSHDRHQVALGRAMGLQVLTNLEELRDKNPDIG
jgi:predicted nucleic acid-binding protein